MQTKINQRDSKGRKHGYWEEIGLFIENKGHYFHGNKEGTWYQLTGNFSELRTVTNYKRGKRCGLEEWYSQGEVVYSEFIAT